MSTILCIETAAEICSVALISDTGPLMYKEVSEANVHSKYLTILIEQVFKESGTNPGELSAVAVSRGPGSYTGLRIGISVAKGICYGAGIPLVAIDTLSILVHGLEKDRVAAGEYIIPLMDARRMEVYCSVFNSRLGVIQTAAPHVLSSDSFIQYLDKDKVHFAGNGAAKFKGICDHPNAVWHLDKPFLSALSMQIPAFEAFNSGKFEDVAYFEPDYLKPVMAVKPKEKWS